MNKTSERRLKLFEDAEFYGAEIIRSNGWICAVCRSYQQLHCFGRGKPKVIPGSNDVDPDCNLRDDEGITDENMKIRDSGKQWIRDGLKFDDQPFEAGWCVAGGDARYYPGSTLAWNPSTVCSSYLHGDVYANAREKGEQCPYLVFLEIDTGKLYISNLQYTVRGMMHLADGWSVSDFNNERNGVTEGGIRRRIKKDSRFADMFQLAAEASLKGLSGAPAKIDVRNPEPAPVVKSRFGMSVREFYAELANLVGNFKNWRNVVFSYSAAGTTKAVNEIKEGPFSSPMFGFGGTAPATVGDFVKYLNTKMRDDVNFQWKPVYGPGYSPVVEIEYSEKHGVVIR